MKGPNFSKKHIYKRGFTTYGIKLGNIYSIYQHNARLAENFEYWLFKQ